VNPLWGDRIPVEPRAETTLEDLRARFPRWVISRIGDRWWANDPSQDISEAQLKAGWQVTIGADSAEQLWEALAEQERLRRQT
jgi:hypothetical protein